MGSAPHILRFQIQDPHHTNLGAKVCIVKKILSIDGGGIKGMFPATFLAEFEEHIGRPLWTYFDLMAGTSTGGIIAIGLAMGIPATEIRNLYESKGPRIFSQEQSGLRGWIERARAQGRFYVAGPKYNSEIFRGEIEGILGERHLGEAKTRLMIPAFHGKTGKVHIFKTAHHDRLKTDYRERASDAAMATAAAPTYFQEFVTANDVGLVDGGIWANNPTGIAVAEGIGTLGWRPSDIRVLSIGCLEDVDEMPTATGALRFARKMAGFFIAGQSHGSLGIAHILTGHVGGTDHKAIFRVNQVVPPGYYSLDATRKIKALKDRALFEARTQKPELERVFFADPAETFTPVYEAA